MTEAALRLSEDQNKRWQDKYLEPVVTECTEDFILPDYLPEIRRLLRLDARLSSNGHFIGHDRIEASGSLLYTLLYTGPQGELTAVPLHSDYSYTVPAKDFTPSEYTCREYVESLQCRPAAPRKICIRARLLAKPQAFWEEEGQIPLTELCPVPKEQTEALLYTAKTCFSIPLHSDDLTAEGGIVLDAVAPEELSVAYSKGSIMVESCRAEDGHMSCRGTLFLQALIQKEDGQTFLQQKKLPFEAELTDPQLQSGDALIAYGICRSVEAELIPQNENGTELLFSMLYRIEAMAHRNRPFTLYTDLYSPDVLLTCHMRQQQLQSFTGAFCGNYSLSGCGKYKEEEEGEVTVIDTTASVHSASLTLLDRKAILSGELEAKMLVSFHPQGEQERLSAAEFLFPYRIEAEMPDVSKEDMADFSLTPVLALGQAEGKDLSITAEVALTVSCRRTELVTIPEKIEATPTDRPPCSGIRVFYPKENDTLWSIGKKYRIPLEQLCKANDIALEDMENVHSPCSLEGMTFCIIPA